MSNRELYAFIQENDVPISLATRALSVSRASYYRHINHVPTPTEKRRDEVRAQLHVAYANSKGRYGAPKLTAAINKQRTDHVSQKYIQKLMHEEGLYSIIQRKWRASSAANPVAERHNLMDQDFSTTTINQKWAGDITYIHTQKDGWTYLCTFMDLYSRRIVGYAYGPDMTVNLVLNAFGNAISNRDVYDGLIVQTDLGSQFISAEFERQLTYVGATHSYSHKGTPYDNAMIESFHATFKKEEYYVNKHHYPSLIIARRHVFEYIEHWYNRVRIHGRLGMKSPVEFEATRSAVDGLCNNASATECPAK
ncbi:putative transposase OrfB [Lacticaseibacillus paracasei]|uniref:Integrase catalytic region n=1 Tax=Lacticaseibacillus manihotivorans DSM 13343 = JCM 12514 TaxID=1423769 RepID=A0A0R1QQU9_9LACO|nr:MULTISPECIES: IS3 family transposase [Lacticaseibacillus]KRL44698.1 integrase catalytic region [Lacticaseibacillus manihotivorans DSM 13343 = JCM 12514]RNE43396.1 putative transposase OrfB [Lacticaseibacillus paracasei]